MGGGAWSAGWHKRQRHMKERRPLPSKLGQAKGGRYSFNVNVYEPGSAVNTCAPFSLRIKCSHWF